MALMSTPAGAVEFTAVLWAAREGGFSALNPETGTTSEGETSPIGGVLPFGHTTHLRIFIDPPEEGLAD